MTRHVCSDHLVFGAWVAAPGYGQSWSCAICGERFWSPGGIENAVSLDVLGRTPELSPEDVR